MNEKMYIVYLKSGKIVTALGCSSYREDEYTEIYKIDRQGKEGVIARFENNGIEGFVIKEVNADEEEQ